MQLSKQTIEVLKNLAAINQSILIKPSSEEGTVLRSMSHEKTIIGIMQIAENFTNELPIYDLSQFLAVLTSMESPVLLVNDEEGTVTIKSGRSQSKIYFANPAMIRAPKDDVQMPAADVTFKLTNDVLQNLLKMASSLQLNDIVIVAGEGVIKIQARDNSKKASNVFEVVVDENYTGEDYKFYIQKDYLKFLPGDYTVNVSSKMISQFVNEDGTRKYYVALEQPKKSV